MSRLRPPGGKSSAYSAAVWVSSAPGRGRVAASALPLRRCPRRAAAHACSGWRRLAAPPTCDELAVQLHDDAMQAGQLLVALPQALAASCAALASLLPPSRLLRRRRREHGEHALEQGLVHRAQLCKAAWHCGRASAGAAMEPSCDLSSKSCTKARTRAHNRQRHPQGVVSVVRGRAPGTGAGDARQLDSWSRPALRPGGTHQPGSAGPCPLPASSAQGQPPPAGPPAAAACTPRSPPAAFIAGKMRAKREAVTQKSC